MVSNVNIEILKILTFENKNACYIIHIHTHIGTWILVYSFIIPYVYCKVSVYLFKVYYLHLVSHLLFISISRQA